MLFLGLLAVVVIWDGLGVAHDLQLHCLAVELDCSDFLPRRQQGGP